MIQAPDVMFRLISLLKLSPRPVSQAKRGFFFAAYPSAGSSSATEPGDQPALRWPAYFCLRLTLGRPLPKAGPFFPASPPSERNRSGTMARRGYHRHHRL
jgi:hypothetical protein